MMYMYLGSDECHLCCADTINNGSCVPYQPETLLPAGSFCEGGNCDSMVRIAILHAKGNLFVIFQELRGSPALEDALKQFKYVSRQYAYFYRKFQSMILRDYFTFDEYKWAVSTVMTRQNQVSSMLRLQKLIHLNQEMNL